MSAAETLYTLVLRLMRPLLAVASRGDGKLARGVRGRHGLGQRMRRWATAERDPARPLVWFHAPSVGEGLQARAVMTVLRQRRPDVQLAYTFFSPSTEAFAPTTPADFADYLPFDLPANVHEALDLLRPDVIAFTKTEVWPNLMREAAQRGTRLALLSATLPPGSSRLGRAARALLTPAYRRLDVVAAISLHDAERYGALGVVPERRTTMGDARFDQVWARALSVDVGAPLLRSLQAADRVTIVAGSTWPADEERLLNAIHDVADLRFPWRLILVPHEPTAEHLLQSEALLEEHTASVQRLSRLGGAAPYADVVLVDRVGTLGELYALADIAYVGGGWGRAGLHSVLEPAAFGVPVLFGPHHTNAREAAELIAAGAAFSVPDAAALTAKLQELLQHPEGRQEVGAAARAYVEAGLGAAERGAEIIEELLRGTDPPGP